ncbi:replication factor C subunit 1-like, partial [Hyla sarda]
MDIRKFFGVTPVAKKSTNEKDKKENIKSPHGGPTRKKSNDKKLKSPVSDEELKKKQLSNKKKRIIYDSDSEEDTPPVKKSKRPQEISPPISKPLKVKKPDPVDFVSDT